MISKDVFDTKSVTEFQSNTLSYLLTLFGFLNFSIFSVLVTLIWLKAYALTLPFLHTAKLYFCHGNIYRTRADYL
jgi:hypothetical protein